MAKVKAISIIVHADRLASGGKRGKKAWELALDQSRQHKKNFKKRMQHA